MTNIDLFDQWFETHRPLGGPTRPGFLTDNHLLQVRGRWCVLPYLRACYKCDCFDLPHQEESNWTPFDDTAYRHRFFRADQLLDWLWKLSEDASKDTTDRHDVFHRCVHHLLHNWLLEIEDYQIERVDMLDDIVQAVSVFRQDALKMPNIRWSRDIRRFSDGFRHVPEGLDPVHTPENARAGLTRHLSTGWAIDDNGKLCASHNTGQDISTSSLGKVARAIPYHIHNAPRRLMLGASLTMHSVPLKVPDDATSWATDSGWRPPVCKLRAVFSTLEGLNYEDALVISASASIKLQSHIVYRRMVQVPALLSHVACTKRLNDDVHQGELLGTGCVDLFALGLAQHEIVAGALKDGLPKEVTKAFDGASNDGLLKVALDHAYSPGRGKLIEWECGPRDRSGKRIISVKMCSSYPAIEGDKLSTWHGIKGVISKILPDEQMPLMNKTSTERAEIVISPIGVIRRGAMGQFREARVNPLTSTGTRSGTILVMRQSQDALPRCRVRGVHPSAMKGQKYGEMEFWALMAHNAPQIANDLLSIDRGTSSWLRKESSGSKRDHRAAAANALNRYLSVIGASVSAHRLLLPQLTDGRLQIQCSGSLPFNIKTITHHKQFEIDVDDEDDFKRDGHIISRTIPLEPPVRVHIKYTKKKTLECEVYALYVLPPWLRPLPTVGRHPLTKLYGDIARADIQRRTLYSKNSPERAKAAAMLVRLVRDCIQETFSEKTGAELFVRREILGRRLNRSARAVIVPAPELRIDQIRIPATVATELFDGLAAEYRRLVLVNRNPTLHRRGLLALEPVIDHGDTPVFGLPLGLLKVLGADFDGDQASVVALTTPEALGEAERLRPGSNELRIDRFRAGRPGFQLSKELELTADDCQQLQSGADVSPANWCAKYQDILNAKIKQVDSDDGGWGSRRLKDDLIDDKCDASIPTPTAYFKGLKDVDWMRQAEREMPIILDGVRKKGRLGGVLRRNLYRRSFINGEQFADSVDAIQVVTERLVQTALSVKSGGGAATFSANKFFKNPHDTQLQTSLKILDDDINTQTVATLLGEYQDPQGLLAWLARPSLATLMMLIASNTSPTSDPDTPLATEDPRLAWFLC